MKARAVQEGLTRPSRSLVRMAEAKRRASGRRKSGMSAQGGSSRLNVEAPPRLSEADDVATSPGISKYPSNEKPSSTDQSRATVLPDTLWRPTILPDADSRLTILPETVARATVLPETVPRGAAAPAAGVTESLFGRIGS
eukprot:GSA25T00022592001.1